jgi:pimeloyl-ACP methyl ester carboxylesterase
MMKFSLSLSSLRTEKVSQKIWTLLQLLRKPVEVLLWRPKRSAVSCLALLMVLSAACVVWIVVLGNHIAKEFLSHTDEVVGGAPDYLVDFFAGRCVHSKLTFGPILQRLEAQNRRLGWKTVQFKARDGHSVSALWLPSSVRLAPRVVIAHPGLSNSLDSAVQAAAHFLRSMNISVLAPNLRHQRGHGDDAERVLRWQYQEEDLLGAWDYAVQDPFGLLGGPLDTRLVGLFGFGLGGLAAQLAFAREPKIRSLLLDGAVHDIRVLLRQFVQARVPPGLTPLFDEQAWERCKDILHRDLDKEVSSDLKEELNLEELLLSRKAPGLIGVIHSEQDTVPPFQRHMLVELLLRTTSKILMQWYPNNEKPEGCDTGDRWESYMNLPSQYESFLCTFWSKIFDGPPTGTTNFGRCQGLGAPPGIVSN